jgi:hypothetical protein
MRTLRIGEREIGYCGGEIDMDWYNLAYGQIWEMMGSNESLTSFRTF